jgi:2-haloacid dehalogenase
VAAGRRKVVSFDCYGTLIDFDIQSATRGIIGDRLIEEGVNERTFQNDFRVMRFEAVLAPYRPYGEILRATLSHAMLRHGLQYLDQDGDALLAAIRQFQPFAEVADALRRIKSAYDLAIISNSEDELIQSAIARIGIDFDYVITAERSRAYKSLRQAFEFALATLGRPPDLVIHTAEGWEYDIMPTLRYIGMRRIWVNRYQERGSAAFQPYDEIPDLRELPQLLGV